MDKWVNWKTIVSTILIAALMGVWGWSMIKVKSVWAEYKQTVEIAQTYQSERSQTKQTNIMLQQIAKDIREIQVATSTLVGIARIQHDGEETSCMLVNEMSKAVIYQKFGKARVTNISSPDSPSIIINVVGVFRNADENDLIRISRRAASMLDVDRNQVVKVRLEQVFEEKK